MITKKDIGKVVYREAGKYPYRLEGVLKSIESQIVTLEENDGTNTWQLKGYGEWFVKENQKEDKTKMKEFYVLWNPDGEMPPTRKFDTLKQAEVVAEKMINSIGEGTMYVLKVVSACSVKKSVWEKV